MSSAALNFLTAAVLAASAPAAADRDLEGLMACSREDDSAIRLACYDREIARLAKSRASRETAAAAPASEAGAGPAESGSAEARFGVHGSELARERAGEQASSELKRMTATVAAISRQPRGELIFTLDNGQIWQQKDAEPYFPVEPGDTVTITRGALSSFRLAASGRFTRVTRIR